MIDCNSKIVHESFQIYHDSTNSVLWDTQRKTLGAIRNLSEDSANRTGVVGQ